MAWLHEILRPRILRNRRSDCCSAIRCADARGDTLGGFIYSQLGKVPAVGDTVEYGPVTVEVLSVAGRRIKNVRAVVVPVGSVSSAERSEEIAAENDTASQELNS